MEASVGGAVALSLAAPPDDLELVEALRVGDERAFASVMAEHGTTMLRVASLYVRDRAVAEEVVQDAWLGALNGIGRFEARASFKTWLFRILTNTAKTRGEREGRSTPFSALAGAETEDGEASADPDRFFPEGGRWSHLWHSSPRRFGDLPESRLLSAEMFAITRAAIDGLPDVARAVITMRDLAGFTADEVCTALELTDGNQRVLLHRARAKVRGTLVEYLETPEPASTRGSTPAVLK